MKSFILIILVFLFVGCSTDAVKIDNPPASPEVLESPPSIPDI